MRRLLAIAALLVAVPASAQQLASDNFDRAEGGLGDNWTTISTTAPVIASGGVVRANGSNVYGCAYYDTVSPSNNQYAHSLVEAAGLAQFNYVGTIVRASTDVGDSMMDWIGIFTDGTAANTFLREHVDGSDNDLNLDGVTFAEFDYVGLRVVGNTATALKNGSPVGPTLTVTLTSGNIGLCNFSAGAATNEWFGGNVEGPPVGTHLLLDAGR